MCNWNTCWLISWWRLWLEPPELESRVQVPTIPATSVRALFLLSLVSHVYISLESTHALPQKMRRWFTASLGEDVSPSLPGDLARLCPDYSRPSLVSSMVVNPKGYLKVCTQLLSKIWIQQNTSYPLNCKKLDRCTECQNWHVHETHHHAHHAMQHDINCT